VIINQLSIIEGFPSQHAMQFTLLWMLLSSETERSPFAGVAKLTRVPLANTTKLVEPDQSWIAAGLPERSKKQSGHEDFDSYLGVLQNTII
jgi:hypothetical protein